MAATSLIYITASLAVAGAFLYLWLLERGLSGRPAETQGATQKPWTNEMIRESYRRVQESPTDIRPYLFSRRSRRYIVVGGSGLVGGWIVDHLLQRGEEPSAIRIFDLKAPVRPEAVKNKVPFFSVDISDASAVKKAVNAPWDSKVSKFPLTVFHTAAYVNPAERKPEFMALYRKVNIDGTQNMLDAARAAGCTCFIATASGAVGIRPTNFFFPPGRPPFMFIGNADPPSENMSLEESGSCYGYTKRVGEMLVRKADDKKHHFRTGVIRPGHGIYGHGLSMPSSLVYDYMRRGTAPTWLHNVVTHFVSAQNVSIAHLAYENTLLNDPQSGFGGRGYACTDPNPALLYSDMYRAMSLLAPAQHPVTFPRLPPALMLFIAHLQEAYSLLRVRYLTFLPEVRGDIKLMQPAVFQLATMHLLYDDSTAQKEIGYRTPITSLEGICHNILYFNEEYEAKLASKDAKGTDGGMAPAKSNGTVKL